MLPKKNRLTRFEVTNIKSKRLKPISGNCFGLVYLPSVSETKVGVIIPKKLVSLAVDRNRLRRLVYQSISPSLPQTTGHFLFLARSMVATADHAIITSEVVNLTSRACPKA